MTLSCRMDARPSDGADASCPGSDRVAPAPPQGRLRAPNVRFGALFLSCTGPSVRKPDRQWSNNDAVPCRPLHWCSDRAASDLRDKDRYQLANDANLSRYLSDATFEQ